MLDQAARRNRDAIAAGRVRLRFGSVECLEESDGLFTKVFSVNVVLFIENKAALFGSLLRLLAPDGTVATTYQPRHKNPTRADAFAMAEEIERAMGAAGFRGHSCGGTRPEAGISDLCSRAKATLSLTAIEECLAMWRAASTSTPVRQ